MSRSSLFMFSSRTFMGLYLRFKSLTHFHLILHPKSFLKNYANIVSLENTHTHMHTHTQREKDKHFFGQISLENTG